MSGGIEYMDHNSQEIEDSLMRLVDKFQTDKPSTVEFIYGIYAVKNLLEQFVNTNPVMTKKQHDLIDGVLFEVNYYLFNDALKSK